MTVVDRSLRQESEDRYLTYALSVVSGRALPDVRDGLKPVQRRILYAMSENLGLGPGSGFRKSAAVIGEVLGKYHPHGDVACYEAMVRMAQDFSLRYPLVEGQGNFGSLDGDNAAAYRYTEARLRPVAVDVIGEINEETVAFKDNFDATTTEPVVFPSRVPNLLINGASGIAVGMATSVPPHNLRDVIKALVELSNDPDTSAARLASLVRAPDFPTGCLVLGSKHDFEEMYRTGRGSVRMRGEWKSEAGERGKEYVVVTSVPYAINKAQLVEKIADLIIQRKVPQLVDVRDESTEDVRVVLELAPGADAAVAVAYLFKHTQLESSFPVNLTVLVPTEGGALRPELSNLRSMLRHFLDFRLEVTRKKLGFERRRLLERMHVLEGLVKIFDALDEAIRIVRKSSGRADAAAGLRKRFDLSEIQSLAVVDMRIYQLSATSIGDVKAELAEKAARVAEIDRVLADPSEMSRIVRDELSEVGERYGDKRRSSIAKDARDVEFNAEDYLVQEDVYVVVTKDGWVKRIRRSNDVSQTRVREGDSVLRAVAVSTVDAVAVVTDAGNLYVLRASDFPASAGFGTPVQKLLKFKDEEKIIEVFGVFQAPSAVRTSLSRGDKLVLVSERGVGFVADPGDLAVTKRSGKRVFKLREGDRLAAAAKAEGDEIAVITRRGMALAMYATQVPVRDAASVGVQLIGLKSGDVVAGALGRPPGGSFSVRSGSGKERRVKWREVERGHRGLRGSKLQGVSDVAAVEVDPEVVQ